MILGRHHFVICSYFSQKRSHGFLWLNYRGSRTFVVTRLLRISCHRPQTWHDITDEGAVESFQATALRLICLNDSVSILLPEMLPERSLAITDASARHERPAVKFPPHIYARTALTKHIRVAHSVNNRTTRDNLQHTEHFQLHPSPSLHPSSSSE